MARLLGTSDGGEKIFQAVRRHHPEQLQIVLAVIDEHVPAVLADEDRHAGKEAMLDTVQHRASSAMQAMDDLLMAVMRVLTHVAARRHGLRPKAEGDIHRDEAWRQVNRDVSIRRNGLPEFLGVARADHADLAARRNGCGLLVHGCLLHAKIPAHHIVP